MPLLLRDFLIDRSALLYIEPFSRSKMLPRVCCREEREHAQMRSSVLMRRCARGAGAACGFLRCYRYASFSSALDACAVCARAAHFSAASPPRVAALCAARRVLRSRCCFIFFFFSCCYVTQMPPRAPRDAAAARTAGVAKSRRRYARRAAYAVDAARSSSAARRVAFLIC